MVGDQRSRLCCDNRGLTDMQGSEVFEALCTDNQSFVDWSKIHCRIGRKTLDKF